MNKIRDRLQSDKAAINTIETFILIALAIFAVLALYTGVVAKAVDGAESAADLIDELPIGG